MRQLSVCGCSKCCSLCTIRVLLTSYSTHYGYKNFYLRGDDWLINNRWEQIVAMRDRLTFVEMVTWYTVFVLFLDITLTFVCLVGMITVNLTSKFSSSLGGYYDIHLCRSFGPIKGNQPAGTTWANGFPHTAWYDMSEYYIQAFKTGSYPAITVGNVYCHP